MINLSEKSSDSEISNEFGKLNMGSGIKEEWKKNVGDGRKVADARKEWLKNLADAVKNDGRDKDYEDFDSSEILEA
jgi:hypothetical protein